MNRLVTSAFIVVSAFVVGGCATNTAEPTPFEQAITRYTKYDSDAVVDGQYLDQVEASLGDNYNKTKSDEEYIRYGKVICILLDDSKEPASSEEYISEVAQPISQAAIEVYCPHHLETIDK